MKRIRAFGKDMGVTEKEFRRLSAHAQRDGVTIDQKAEHLILVGLAVRDAQREAARRRNTVLQ